MYIYLKQTFSFDIIENICWVNDIFYVCVLYGLGLEIVIGPLNWRFFIRSPLSFISDVKIDCIYLQEWSFFSLFDHAIKLLNNEISDFFSCFFVCMENVAPSFHIVSVVEFIAFFSRLYESCLILSPAFNSLETCLFKHLLQVFWLFCEFWN